MNIQTPGSNMAHAVLIFKIDEEFVFMKNSNPEEPIIKVPLNRPTQFQNHIYRSGPSDFNLSLGTMKQKFENCSTKQIDWSLDQDDWVFNDEGFYLKLQRKRDNNLSKPERARTLSAPEMFRQNWKKIQNDNLIEQVNELSQQLSHAQLEKNSMSQQLATVQQINGDMTRLIASIQLENLATSQQNADLSQQVASVQGEQVTMSNIMVSMQSELTSMTQRITDMHKEIYHLKNTRLPDKHYD